MPQLSKMIESGRDFQPWYAEAHDQIRKVCELESWDYERFADILALTSPKVAVIRNIRIAFQYCHNGEFFHGVMKNIRTSVSNYENGLGFSKRAHKTKPFAEALKGDFDAIVLDSWMAQAYGIEQARFAIKGVRESCQRSIKRLARKFSMRYAEAQACLWAGVQRFQGVNPARFDVMSEYQNWLTFDRQYPLFGSIQQATVKAPTFDAPSVDAVNSLMPF